ncbi:MAG: hypothetical protein KAW12_22010 [Candidatus Aminicenantes bacterium]|nr:hypothetical protein [Candidatus Aminicenantes bacterium]
MLKKNSPDNCRKIKTIGITWLTAAVFLAILTLPQNAAADETNNTKGLYHSFHVGATYPLGSFDDTTDANVHCRFDFSYTLTDKLFVTLFGGFSQFTDDYGTRGL